VVSLGPLILSGDGVESGVLPAVGLLFVSIWVIFQTATWRAPLFGALSRPMSRRQRLDLHRALAQTANFACLVPLAALGIAWFRGQVEDLGALLELSTLCIALSALMGWVHNVLGAGYADTLADPRKRLSLILGGWRSATGLNVVLHGLLWVAVWVEYSGGPSLSAALSPSPLGAIPLGLAVAVGVSHRDRPLRRVLVAQSVGRAATVVAMVEAWSAIQRGEDPVPVALFWTGLGAILSIPLAGPDKGMFKPVGAIEPPVGLYMSGPDKLRVVIALGVLIACWSATGLPWLELSLVGSGLGYLSWSRLRRQRIEHLLTGQTHQLRKDKEKVEELNQVLAESFSKFVPRDLVDELVAEGQLVRLRGEEREVSILFSDIRGYSTIIETLPPIRVLKVLNLYFNSMEKVIDRHGGTILEFVGDAILAVFGAPGDLPGHAEAATMCAVEMREALAEFNAEMEKQGLSETWRAQGYEQLGARIGVHKGHVVAGTLGGTNQVRYSVLGDTVNVAARLEAYNKELGTEILISDAVFDSLGDRFELPATDHGPILLKGRGSAQRCYSL